MMYDLAAIGVGGALGAMARFGVGHAANEWLGTDFPYGTLIANVAGSFLIGIVFVLLVEKALLSPVWRSALIVGFLGAFTTFSTFSLQSLALMEAGRFFAAATYILSSVIVCIAAAAFGMWLGRQLS